MKIERERDKDIRKKQGKGRAKRIARKKKNHYIKQQKKELCIVRKATAAAAAKSCLTLCDPMDGSPQGSPVPGILQARTLEWVAISFSNA